MNKKDLQKLTNNLPKYPGIMGRHRLFNSSVLIPLIKIKGEYYILFQKRAKHISQGGDICFPGGKAEESDKSSKHTALRETKEEIGIKKKDIKVIGRLDTMLTSFGAVVKPYVAKVNKRALKNIKIDPSEVDKIILIPLSHFKSQEPKVYYLRSEVKPFHIKKDGKKEVYLPAKELGLPKNYRKPWGHKKHKVYVYKYKNEIIWGMTAVILNDLLNKY